MQPYPSYLDSGVDWLGELPMHWSTAQLRRKLAIVSGGTPPSSDDECWGGDIVWVTPDDLGRNAEATISGSRRMITEHGVEASSANVSPAGSVVLSTRAPIGHLAIAGTPVTTNQGCRTLVPKGDIDSRYAYYAVGVSEPVLQALGKGSTFMELSSTDLGAHRVPLPPLHEQIAISSYLGRETARIDALIARQRELVERLDEYCSALVTHTVTQGLPPAAATAAGIDPEPRMKASGVEWLGLIPAHWEVVDNRRLFRERDERSDDGDGELLTVSHITGVTRRSEKPDVGMFMAESLEGYKRCQAGDLVINTMWAWMGAAGTAVELGLVSPSYNIYTPDPNRLLPEFVDRAYRSRRYVLGMTSESRGIWSSRLRLYPQQFMSLRTAVPPLAEQAAIVAYLESAEARSFRLTTSARLAIERLREYRTALISAAVTGKIDVRDAMTQGTEGEA